jgi:hypothetical protein
LSLLVLKFFGATTKDTCALVCFLHFARFADAKLANTQYPEGKPLLRGSIKFSKFTVQPLRLSFAYQGKLKPGL